MNQPITILVCPANSCIFKAWLSNHLGWTDLYFILTTSLLLLPVLQITASALSYTQASSIFPKASIRDIGEFAPVLTYLLRELSTGDPQGSLKKHGKLTLPQPHLTFTTYNPHQPTNSLHFQPPSQNVHLNLLHARKPQRPRLSSILHNQQHRQRRRRQRCRKDKVYRV